MADLIEYQTQVAIIGGGITGLWLYHRLRSKHIDACLIEQSALGDGQTIVSQGIIHGGMKYALKGKATQAALQISQMPAIWNASLQGADASLPDLTQVTLLSKAHYLCTLGGFGAHFKALASSQALHGSSQVLAKSAYPPILKDRFKGSICQVDETVMHVPSLLSALAKPYREGIIKAQAAVVHGVDHKIDHLKLSGDKAQAKLKAKYYVFCGGSGNRELLADFVDPPPMQHRPLHQVWLKFPSASQVSGIDSHALFAHFIKGGVKPQFTVTTHPSEDGSVVWYLGGDLAETGLMYPEAEQVQRAQKLLNEWLPWVNFDGVTWGGFLIDRAEQAQPKGTRPDHPFVEQLGQAIVCWPVKLTYAPSVAEQVLNLMDMSLLLPNSSHSIVQSPFDRPDVAKPPWDL